MHVFRMHRDEPLTLRQDLFVEEWRHVLSLHAARAEEKFPGIFEPCEGHEQKCAY